MDDAELLERCDLNLVEFNREGARSTPGGVVREQDGLVFFVPQHRFPVGFTGVMRTDRNVPAADVLARARDYFGALGCGYTHVLMMHRDADLAAALEKAGIGAMGNSPGMVLDEPLPEEPLAGDVTIEKVAGDIAVREFADVTGAAYATMGLPPKFVAAHFTDPRFFALPHVAGFLARVAGQAVAAAMVMVTHGVAGLYWVGTTPEARGRGLAAACTRVAGNAGFAMGARVAALQASKMGEPVYLRLGYREVTRYPWYAVMP